MNCIPQVFLFLLRFAGVEGNAGSHREWGERKIPAAHMCKGEVTLPVDKVERRLTVNYIPQVFK